MKLKLFGLALLSGLLLAIGWPPFPLTVCLFFALVPLFEMERRIIDLKFSTLLFSGLVFLSFLVWHLISHQWVFGLGSTTAAAIVSINSLILTCFLIPSHLMKRAGKMGLGQLTFAAGWMSFDLLHLNWELAYPLLNLGNGLARFPQIIQWYEFTGAFGGSIWILGINFLVYQLIQDYKVNGINAFRTRLSAGLSFGLLLPILLSLVMYVSYAENERSTEVVVVHPNIDTRTERYITDQKELVDRYIKYTKQSITPETDYVLWTENALTEGAWISEVDQMNLLRVIRDSFADYPSTKIITGAIMYKFFSEGKGKNMPPEVTYKETLNQAYYTYSSALQIDPRQTVVLNRSKQQLVPIEESIPYPNLLGSLRELIGNYTGMTFSAGKSNHHVFTNKSDGAKVTPLICYESAFGSITGQYTQKGAQALFVMLNEGWYHDWQGASQFLYFSVLRAIETRRSVARSSNDGISAFINPRGDIIEQVGTYEPTALRQNISLNKKVTLYARLGDYLGWMGLIAGVLSCLYFFSLRFFTPSKPASAKQLVKTKSVKKGKGKKKKKK